MGLDATVFCDCYETGKLQKAPNPAWELFVDPDGQLECRNEDLDECIAFDNWREHACSHEGGYLTHHYIGNVAHVGALRELLSQTPEQFPIILNRVIHNGTHCGDQLPVALVRKMADEIARLVSVRCPNKSRQELLDFFKTQMTELADNAMAMNKPISF